MITRRSLLTCVVALSCNASFGIANDDRDIEIHTRQNQGSAVKYVWAVKQSRLAALPRWDPITAEAPVSPHQAVKAAIEFIRDRFGSTAKLRVSDILLFTRGLEPNAVVPEVWTYTVSFDIDPEVAEDYRELLRVEVLMDGKVIVPVEKPSKPPE